MNKIDLVIAGYIFYNHRVLLVHHRQLRAWLPVGGHIDKNETPDRALKREAKEEINLNIKILGQSDISTRDNIQKNLARPFYVNLHSVGSHYHCCFFYVCRAKNIKNLKISRELKNAQWFSKKDLSNSTISVDVKSQALRAFKLLKTLK